MGDEPIIASQLLYGRRLAHKRHTLQSLQYSEYINYKQLLSLLKANILPLPWRREFTNAHIIGEAESWPDRSSGEKIIITLAGVVPNRRLVMTLYQSGNIPVISLDYEARLNLSIPGPGAGHFIVALARSVQEEVLLEVCSTSPKTLEHLIDDYPPGWVLGCYRGQKNNSQESCLRQLAETRMLSPEDSRLIREAASFDQLVLRHQGRDALLNCNQYVVIYLSRLLDQLSRG